MLWSKNHLLLPNCMSVFFLQRHNINIKNQSTPGVHAVFPVGGAWTRFERHVISHFSVKMYTKMKELGPIWGMRQKILLYPPMHDTN